MYETDSLSLSLSLSLWVSFQEHCPGNPNFDFHKYMMRTLEVDFRKIVGIR
jgi:mlo protein